MADSQALFGPLAKSAVYINREFPELPNEVELLEKLRLKLGPHASDSVLLKHIRSSHGKLHWAVNKYFREAHLRSSTPNSALDYEMDPSLRASSSRSAAIAPAPIVDDAACSGSSDDAHQDHGLGFDQFPVSIVEEICGHLDAYSLCQLAQASRVCRRAADSDTSWAKLFSERWGTYQFPVPLPNAPPPPSQPSPHQPPPSDPPSPTPPPTHQHPPSPSNVSHQQPLVTTALTSPLHHQHTHTQPSIPHPPPSSPAPHTPLPNPSASTLPPSPSYASHALHTHTTNHTPTPALASSSLPPSPSSHHFPPPPPTHSPHRHPHTPSPSPLPWKHRYRLQFEYEATMSCPRCSGQRIVPILYGFPSTPLLQGVQQGRLLLGGDHLIEDCHVWACTACNASYRFFPFRNIELWVNDKDLPEGGRTSADGHRAYTYEL